MILRARQYQFTFPRAALIMGIVNVTPDSFSDGGQFLAPADAIAHAQELVKQGADMIDIGGESTRPQAEPALEAEELKRVLPVIEQLSRSLPVPISIDTQKPVVARRALEAGASLVNDVAANRSEPSMWQVVAEAQAGYVCMHMQGTPQTMQLNPTYQDVVREVGDFFSDRLGRLEGAGVHPEQVILDIGMGFGKKLEHNLQLLAGLKSFTRFERAIMLGVSRKSFIGNLLGLPVRERLPASIACACQAVEAGVNIIRTHDVAATSQAVRMTEAILASRRICSGT